MGARRAPRGRVVLACLLVLGALVRLGYLVERRAAPDFAHPVIDAGFHDDWARTLAFGEARPVAVGADEERPDPARDLGLATEPYLRPPGYPFVLAAVYRLSGGSPTAAVVVQMGLGLLSVALAFLVARRFGLLSAAIAGGVMATHWTLVYFEGELHAPPLVIALQLGAVLALLRAGAREPDRGGRHAALAALAAGLLLGAGALVRPNVLVQVAVAAPWLALAARRRSRRPGPGPSPGPGPGRAWLAPVALLLGGVALAVAPAAVRNLRVSGEFVPITTGLGVNLWIGNHAGADGLIADDLAGLGRFRTSYDWPAIVESLERETGRELNTVQASAWFRDRAIDWMRSEPAAFLALTARKAALFWGPAEVANNKDIAAVRRHSAVLRFLPGPFPLLAFAAFAGLGLFVAARRAGPSDPADPADPDGHAAAVALVAGLVLATFLSLLPFFAAARFRVPMVPYLALLAGLLPAWRGATAAGRGAALSLAAAPLLLAWWAAPDVANSDERYLVDRGRALYAKVTEATPPERRDALYAAARVELERAVRVGDGPSAHFELGVLEQRTGDLAAARRRYEACLARDPGRAPAHFNLGFVHEGLGDVPAALRAFRAAAGADRTWAAPAFHEGRLLARAGRLGPALTALREAHRRDPKDAATARTLARYLLGARDPRLRDVAEGVRLAEGLPPDSPGAAETLAWARAAEGRVAEARAAIERAIESASPAERARLEGVGAAIAAGEPPWRFR